MVAPTAESAGVFVVAMAVVCSSVLATSGYRLATETRPGVRTAAAFLLYVSILTGAATFKGMRVLRQKQRSGRGGALDLLVAGILWAWLLPTLVGVPLLSYWGRAYRRRFEAPPATAKSADTAVDVSTIAA